MSGFLLYRSHLPGYMRRFILATPWGTLRLHRILRSDHDRDLHDHPWDFASFLLSGGYVEHVPCLCSEGRRSRCTYPTLRPRFSLVRHRAEDAHRLELERRVWTLVVTGPARRAWGFHAERGWVRASEYLGARGEALAYDPASEVA